MPARRLAWLISGHRIALSLSHMLERTAGCVLPMLCGAEVTFARFIQQLGEHLGKVRPTTLLISVPRIYERVARRIQAGPACVNRVLYTFPGHARLSGVPLFDRP